MPKVSDTIFAIWDKTFIANMVYGTTAYNVTVHASPPEGGSGGYSRGVMCHYFAKNGLTHICLYIFIGKMLISCCRCIIIYEEFSYDKTIEICPVIIYDLVFISCDLFKTEIIVDFDYNLFLTKKNAWNVLKPNNYQFNLLKSGTGFYEPIDALIIVENGQYKEEFSNIEYGGTTYYTYQTIDNIYETIETTYKEYNNTQRSKNEVYLERIKVEYDSENNIPLKIEYFYYVPANVADAGEYWIYKITGFKNND